MASMSAHSKTLQKADALIEAVLRAMGKASSIKIDAGVVATRHRPRWEWLGEKGQLTRAEIVRMMSEQLEPVQYCGYTLGVKIEYEGNGWIKASKIE